MLRPLKRPTGSNLADLGRAATRGLGFGQFQLLCRIDVVGKEAVRKACGVRAAKLQGHNETPPRSNVVAVNVGTSRRRRLWLRLALVCDPAFLLVAWRRVRGNRGSRSAGVDNESARSIEQRRGHESFLSDLRTALRQRSFCPLPVRERRIPKGDGRYRRLGIPTVADRVVQAAMRLALEPIFESDFQPCSYGFRPKRRAQDAITEIHFYTSRGYEWIVEGDIEACFDRINHTAVIERVRNRIEDNRVLALVKAFLKAGILTELGSREATHTGTPQGGILSPLLANIALSALDEHFAHRWSTTMSTVMRRKTLRRGLVAHLHLPVAEGREVCTGQGQGAYLSINGLHLALADASQDQGNSAGMVTLLPSRCIEVLLQQARFICVATLHALAPQEAPEGGMARPETQIHETVAYRHQWRRTVHRCIHPGDSLPVSRRSHSKSRSAWTAKAAGATTSVVYDLYCKKALENHRI